jgi:hypothetical protein
MVFLQSLYLFLIFLLLILELVSQLLMLLGRVLNIRILDLLIGFKSNLILLLKSLYLLPINNIQFFFL